MKNTPRPPVSLRFRLWRKAGGIWFGGGGTGLMLAAGTAFCLPGRLSAQIAQTAYLKAWNAGAEDMFGDQVALSGNTLAVAAIGRWSVGQGVDGDEGVLPAPHPNGADSGGAVYVFVRDSNGFWTRQAYLRGIGPEPVMYFGTALCMEGDILAALSGVPGEGGSPTPGVIDVFSRTAEGWRPETRIRGLSDGSADVDHYPMALSGDTLLISDSGKETAHVYVRRAGKENEGGGPAGFSWELQASLKTGSGFRYERFGWSVALHGDTAAVGALMTPGPDEKHTNTVYVFTRKGAVWTQEAVIRDSPPREDERFGTVLALRGDLLVVNSDVEDAPGRTALYDRKDGKWSLRGFLPTASFSMAITDTSLLLGDRISAKLYRTAPAAWRTLVASLTPSPTAMHDDFGNSVALEGDTAVVCAPQESRAPQQGTGTPTDPRNVLNWSGAAYLFNTRRAVFSVSGFEKNGDQFVLDFDGTAGISDWMLKGSGDPASLNTDLRPKTLFTEESPGKYRAVVDVAGLGPRYFLRLEHD